MIKSAEFVSLGHPDKTADFISSYLLDSLIVQDSSLKYGVEVMVKDNTVVLGGEISGHVSLENLETTVKDALRYIGYDEHYAAIWGDCALNITRLRIINLIGLQSPEIQQGVVHNGWGDQGVFVGYACQGPSFMPKELYLARQLNKALYEKAKTSDIWGLDIKTQITLDENNDVQTVVIAVPSRTDTQPSRSWVAEILKAEPKHLIINGTGSYTYHSTIADCGMTGRKLACDFYSTAAPIGGGSPWTKDGTKADLTLNLLARELAVKNLGDADEAFVYLSCCIGRSDLPSAVLKRLTHGKCTIQNLNVQETPSELIQRYQLNKPIYAQLCSKGLFY